MNVILEIENLIKKYDNIFALNEINLTIHEKEFIVLIGSSGAGKTTLFRCINLLERVTRGNILFKSVNLAKLSKRQSRKYRREIAMVFQQNGLIGQLNVLENVLHGRLGYKNIFASLFSLYDSIEKKEAKRLLKLFGVDNYMYQRADKLSVGEQQRVGIARALMQKPRLLLCDEPLSAIDKANAQIIIEEINKQMNETNMSCIMSLHNMFDNLSFATRIIAINKGKIIYDGLPSGLQKMDFDEIYNA